MAKRVAVVGAGMSGASCAHRLKMHSCNVRVFEKSRGVGGRMCTKRGDEDDTSVQQCDHGAQYFTARSKEFQTQVVQWKQKGIADMWAAKPLVYDGAKWEESSSDIGRWCGTPFMHAPVKDLLQGNDVETQSTVDELSRTSDGQWRLHTVEKGWSDETYDAVVIGVPAPQATPLISPHSSLSDISNGAVMKGCWAVMLHYTPAMGSNIPFDSAFIGHGPLSWISRDSSKPARPEKESSETWLLHATSAWSAENIEADSVDVAEDLINAFCSLNLTSAYKILPPEKWRIHKWKYATTHPNLDIHSAWDESSQIGMCGDWLNVGKVEGAWLSGRHLADSIMQRDDDALNIDETAAKAKL